jgi:carotenoid cleavage dioxygenase-like enzyme
LVDGDPVADVNILRSKDRLVAILKGGDPYKLDRSALQHPQMRAAE